MGQPNGSRRPDFIFSAMFPDVDYLGGYLPIEDHGLIGNGRTAALVGRDGSIDWMCVPRFDSPPIFCGLLDRHKGGRFYVKVDEFLGARQYYQPNSSVLVTELRAASGLLRITDLMPFKEGTDLSQPLPADMAELLRMIEVVQGEVTFQIDITTHPKIDVSRERDGFHLRSQDGAHVDLLLTVNRPMDDLSQRITLRTGENVAFSLRWEETDKPSSLGDPYKSIRVSIAAWQRWLRTFDYHGPQSTLVQRSAITIKMLDYLPQGSLLAAPTTSLPERVGGERNWDYRFVWVRDGSFSVYALRRIGLVNEANNFLRWLLTLAKGHRLRIMYTIDGGHPGREREDYSLEGYRKSQPVRWSNGAADQVQHDVYGEVLDCAYQWANHGGNLSDELWSNLHRFVERAMVCWDTPDQGIWEVRTEGSVQTYSAGICQVALDRGRKLASRYGLQANIALWQRTAEEITKTILDHGWNEQKQFIASEFGGDTLDAAILGLPLRRVIPADHPKMVATVKAVRERLHATGDGLIFRYHPSERNDGLEGNEGAFVLTSFWLVDNLTLQGKLDEAQELYDSLCHRVNPLGLLSEEIDPTSGRFLGNFPQAFSHIGQILSGVNLAKALNARDQHPASAPQVWTGVHPA